nr:extracellular solute-binding protein [Angustibacter aerolatus]
MAALTLAACGGGSAPAASSRPANEIHVLVYGDAANKVEKQAIATYNKTAKVKAVLDTIPGADYQTKPQTIINTKQAPDVFFNWGGGSIQPFVKANLLLPLDEMIKQDPQAQGGVPALGVRHRCRRRQGVRRADARHPAGADVQQPEGAAGERHQRAQDVGRAC